VGPLPQRLLSFLATDGELVPAWFSDRDRPWLRDLLGEVEAARDTLLVALAQRWQSDDPDPRAGTRGPIAQFVVLALLRRQRTAPAMAAVRRELFRTVATGTTRDAALAEVAAAHCLSGAELAASLFADLPHERRVCPPVLEPSRLMLLANLALVQGLLRHAVSAQLWLRGASRAVLRTAWLHGAGLAIEAVDGEQARLGWRAVGGTAAARRARSLGSIVPLLPWAQRYELRAHCAVRGESGTLVLATGDPILPGPEPRRFDSRLEQALAHDLAALGDWQLLREPVPIRLAHGLAFPDFELARRSDGARWLLEVAGLRDPAALPAKIELLHAVPRLVLCLPRRLVPEDLRGHPRIVPFVRRVHAHDVIAAVQGIQARSAGQLPMAPP